MSIVVTGYAGLDYAVRLDSPPRPDRTATIVSRAAEWPRVGGSPAYVAAALVASGVRDVAPISWVGDDAEGAIYRNRLQGLGVRTDGISTGPGQTPVCVLAYQPDGRCYCLYDPGLTASADLNTCQRVLLGEADAICVTVGPTKATRETLRLARSDATLLWAVKADPRSVPLDLTAALAARADVVVFSKGEADFAAESFAAAGERTGHRLRIETRGREGVAFMENDITRIVPVEAVEADDSTGAGDTFVGGFLAAWMKTADPELAIKAGAATARTLLLSRANPARRS